MRATICLLFLLSALFVPTHAFSDEKVGHVQTLKGFASIIRGDQTVPAAIGLPVHQGDLVRTGKESSVGIVLDDETNLSLGPSSELLIKEFVFDPNNGKFSFLAKMIKGTFVYFSGLIGKLSPKAVRLEIPAATINVRGTKLLVSVEE